MPSEPAEITNSNTSTADPCSIDDCTSKRNLICQPWQLPNMIVLDPTITDTSKSTETVTSIRSQEPTRHIAVYSDYLLDFTEQAAFFQEIQKATGRIRAIYPYISASVTIISYYSLLDAQRCLSLIETQLYPRCKYKAYYAKPCCINKNMNERVFVILTAKALFSNNDRGTVSITSPSIRQFDYLKYLSQIGSIYSISELASHPDCIIINIEYHDERASERLSRQFDYAVIENVQFRVHTSALNNHFNCTCYKPIYFPRQLAHQPRQQDFGESEHVYPNNNTAAPLPSFISSDSRQNTQSYFFFEPFGSAQVNPSSSVSTPTFSRPETIRSVPNEWTGEVQRSSSMVIIGEEQDRLSLGTIDTATTRTFTSSSTPTGNVFEAGAGRSTSRGNVVARTASEETVNTGSPEAIACVSSISDNEEECEVEDLRINPLPSSSANAATSKTPPCTTALMMNNMNDVDLERIMKGLDKRTTFMIRNIPNKYTQQMLIDCIDSTHAGTYDFLYLRIDFQNKCNVGYAFINFIDPKSVISFAEERVGKRWRLFNSEKRCALSYANIQGKESLIRKFKNSHVMDENIAYRPKLFYSSGPNKGKEQNWGNLTALSSTSVSTSGANRNRTEGDSESSVKRDSHYSRKRYSSY